MYGDAEKRKEILKIFIRNNPSTTHREIRRQLHLKPERVYLGGMTEAFREAGVEPPRTFEMKSKEKRKKILIDYLRKNPNVGTHIISKETKINYNSVFKNVLEFYQEAGVPYLKEHKIELLLRDKEKRRQMILGLLRENPAISIEKVIDITKTHPYTLFKNIEEMYLAAGVKLVAKGEKIRINKRKRVIAFLKNNPLATQREINRECKTHVQIIFNNGIFGAYELAGINYPYQRIPFHGAALNHIKNSAKDFESEVALKLSNYGNVSRLVKIKKGFADIIFERNSKKAIIEVKNYFAHEISTSQIKQLNKYLEDCNCNIGFLICRRKPSKDKFLIGKNTMYVLTADELSRIPEVIDKDL